MHHNLAASILVTQRKEKIMFPSKRQKVQYCKILGPHVTLSYCLFRKHVSMYKTTCCVTFCRKILQEYSCIILFLSIYLSIKMREKKMVVLFLPTYGQISVNMWTRQKSCTTNRPAWGGRKWPNCVVIFSSRNS